MTTSPARQGHQTQPTGIKDVWPYIAVTAALLVGYAMLPSGSDFVVSAIVVWLITLVACGAMISIEFVRAGQHERPIWPYIAIAVLALLLIGLAIHTTRIYHSGGYKSLGPLITFVSALICIVVASKANTKARAARPPTPVGHTTDGQPIFPVVGYAADGRPITADKAARVDAATGGTNSMAIVALITGLVVSPLGILFGHLALSEINRTGQDGRGFAIAGLVLGYVSVTFIAIALLAITSF